MTLNEASCCVGEEWGNKYSLIVMDITIGSRVKPS